MRAVGLVALFAGVAMAAAGCSLFDTDPQPDHADPVVQVMPAKAEFRLGEPVSLTVTVSNREASACRVSGVPDGVVTLRSMTRDGTPVEPVVTEGTYEDGLAGLLLARLVAVEPGASASMTLTSAPHLAIGDRPGLRTATSDGGSRAFVVLWPVDKPGAYDLVVGYLLPPLPGDGLCRIASGPVTVGFTIRGG